MNQTLIRERQQIHFFAYLVGTGIHLASWRHETAFPQASIDFSHQVKLAGIAEEARFDAIFLGDSLAIDETSNPGILNRFDPIGLVTALGAVTSNIGLIATSSTSYDEPFNFARAALTADHISGGRVGWNIVTTRDLTNSTAGNFSADEHFDHSLRYRRAEEFVEVTQGLWNSWDPDAFLYNKVQGRFFDRRKLSRLDYKGEFFQVSGPLNIAPSPQHSPLLAQAGTSVPGQRLGARFANALFASHPDIPQARQYRESIRAQAKAFGRNPDEIYVYQAISPVVADTRDEAFERIRELDSLITDQQVLDFLQEYFAGQLDFTGLGADATVAQSGIPTITQPRTDFRSAGEQIRGREDEVTLKDLYSILTGDKRNHDFIGTPRHVADSLERWHAEGAADGFNLMFSLLPQDLERFASGVIPLLQERGLARREYSGTTLKSHLGLGPQPKGQP
ncbi:LLM class flavin-dependent oxidoreductase [Paenarthrobacter aurescens]|uniref:Putative monooxygenase YxeK n=1 Tax=Paenarthrobacter aurescens TaxID=43663 RepID=A0A4Y3N8D9_PAEAU|nr:LLM class flavin-dependent oxidoreductase [Paenarthrobacter aurescens]UKA49202.1 LLM class flavin-dependent oxidoreductase [Arthrobacter sp. FW305-123]MDO6144836.1 LLM class flavin-dependent oxidoreductase [Paenarthrobacter aurescens]MDO6148681.1 LLM class flavin-dependent oxidoreductase [Paenarthrobacter aurescens]MDO6159927.1 LLM class flavin-dependent oxidoreductase [Paenarthrobacter aurescens]MDO6163786.1 LLM class flavin-dependent oxidoreductase [Paenarthrobacter aurescens]